MGEVYWATDSKLGREVAIKVLPPSFMEDRERVARFEREAKVLASLSHPYIAAIYGLEETPDGKALILELVEGETLDERLRREPMPVEEAIEVGRQIAESLEAAHAKGIIHRDLKPANVKVTGGGVVKVLDFGLAKALEVGHDTTPSSRPRSGSLCSQGTLKGRWLNRVSPHRMSRLRSPMRLLCQARFSGLLLTCRLSKRGGERWKGGPIFGPLGVCASSA